MSEVVVRKWTLDEDYEGGECIRDIESYGQLLGEHNAVVALVERMRPVVEAALTWEQNLPAIMPASLEAQQNNSRRVEALIAAVRAYRELNTKT
jgi:hypothetical protein